MLRRLLALSLLMAACGGSEPAGPGFAVQAGSTCHTLLLAQCGCCGSGEAYCEATVEALVAAGKARSNLDAGRCQAALDAQAADPALLCAGLKASPAVWEATCIVLPSADASGDAADDAADAADDAADAVDGADAAE